MAVKARPIRRIYWAVDAFEQPGPVRENVLQALKCLVEHTDAEVIPSYVLSPTELSLTIEFTPPWVSHYKPAAEAALQSLTRGVKVPHLKKPQVLVQNSASIRAAVTRLSNDAEKHRGSVILVSTHARGGMQRFLLGSFAETLILHSKVPVFVTGPNKKIGSPCFKRILFPTDLGENYKEQFQKCLKVTSQLKAHLSIFHSTPNPVEPLLQTGMFLLGGNWVPVHRYFAEDRERRESQLEECVKIAKKAGVKADYHIDEQTGSVSDLALAYARKQQIQLILMGAQSGPITTALVGSITRQIVRHARIPVMIVR